MRAFRLLPIVILAGCAQSQPVDPADPRVAIMNAIDLGVALPAGAHPLADYDRHYAWTDASHRQVKAVFIPGDVRGRSWPPIEKLPAARGQGCDAITIVYDVADRRAASVTCNPHG